jgi:nucleotide-binding universal stress UspA family protein
VVHVILCAVDDSAAAERVVDTARWLAEGLKTPLVVVHVSEDPDGADEVVGRVRARLDTADADVRVLPGSPTDAIREAAEEAEPELVVVGSRGRGPLKSTLLGSVSHDLATGSRYPVVVVPSGEDWAADAGDGGAEASVVCGVDGSDEALAGARFAARLATQLGCRLVVVHARQNVRSVLSYPGARSETPPVTGQEDAVQGLVDEVIKRAAEATGGSAVTVVESGPPDEVLESVADREAGRLIVISARGLGGIRSALLGSVAAKLTSSAARPVLVLSDAAVAGATESEGDDGGA